jgi:hypothetical protein
MNKIAMTTRTAAISMNFSLLKRHYKNQIFSTTNRLPTMA